MQGNNTSPPPAVANWRNDPLSLVLFFHTAQELLIGKNFCPFQTLVQALAGSMLVDELNPRKAPKLQRVDADRLYGNQSLD